MRVFPTVTAGAVLLALSTSMASAEVSVERFAQSQGMRATALAPQTAVEVAGPAIRIVLRPGDQVVEINGRSETLAAAPYVRRGELYLSDADSRRLITLAGASGVAVSGPLAQAQEGNQPPAGAITLDVKPVVGSETLAVSGRAPAGRTVQITLYATVSRDVPDVVLSRKTIVSDGSGAFASTVPLAPAFFRGAIVTIVATTPPSGPSASARYTVGAPNVTVPPDNLPYNIR